MNVLAVDDDPQQRSMVVARMRAEWPDATVHEAASVEGALRILDAFAIDLVTLELALPQADGGLPEPTEERVTLDHRAVAAGFAGRRLLADLVARPALRVRVHTILPLDHPDARIAIELGAEMVTRKRTAFEIPVMGPDARADARMAQRQDHA